MTIVIESITNWLEGRGRVSVFSSSDNANILSGGGNAAAAGPGQIATRSRKPEKKKRELLESEDEENEFTLPSAQSKTGRSEGKGNGRVTRSKVTGNKN